MMCTVQPPELSERCDGAAAGYGGSAEDTASAKFIGTDLECPECLTETEVGHDDSGVHRGDLELAGPTGRGLSSPGSVTSSPQQAGTELPKVITGVSES